MQLPVSSVCVRARARLYKNAVLLRVMPRRASRVSSPLLLHLSLCFRMCPSLPRREFNHDRGDHHAVWTDPRGPVEEEVIVLSQYWGQHVYHMYEEDFLRLGECTGPLLPLSVTDRVRLLPAFDTSLVPNSINPRVFPLQPLFLSTRWRTPTSRCT